MSAQLARGRSEAEKLESHDTQLEQELSALSALQQEAEKSLLEAQDKHQQEEAAMLLELQALEAELNENNR